METHAETVCDGKKMEIALLAPPYLDHWWPYIERDMDKIPHTWQHRYTKEVLYDMAMERAFQVWAVGPKGTFEFIVFSHLEVFPVANVLVIDFCFGKNLEEVLPLLDATFERFAQFQSCSQIEVRGRVGWKKMLEPLGFTQTQVVMTRPVKLERMH